MEPISTSRQESHLNEAAKRVELPAQPNTTESGPFDDLSFSETKAKYGSFVRYRLKIHGVPFEDIEDREQELWIHAYRWGRKYYKKWKGSIRTYLKLIIRDVVAAHYQHARRNGRPDLYQMPVHPNGQLIDFGAPDGQQGLVLLMDLVDKLSSRHRKVLHAYLGWDDYWAEWHRQALLSQPRQDNGWEHAAKIRALNDKRQRQQNPYDSET